MLFINSSGAATDDSISSQNAVTAQDSTILKSKDDARNKLKSKREEHAKRLEAAKRFKAARKAAGALTIPAIMDPGGIPHYFGPYPNYANSPIPTFPVVITPTTIGNPLIARNTPTDTAANVLVVNTNINLSNGTLTAFQIYNQPGSGPNTFNAYVLRPTGVNGQYSVIFDSGPLNVLSVAAGQTETFTISMPVNVQTGGMIALFLHHRSIKCRNSEGLFPSEFFFFS